MFIVIFCALCVTAEPEVNKALVQPSQNVLDYLYNDWSYNEKFGHPQYDAVINTTIEPFHPTTTPANTTKVATQKKDPVKHHLTKYALKLFKDLANRTLNASRLDLRQDLNYTDDQDVNEFIVKWYLKRLNLTRGDIYFTKDANGTVEVTGKDLNNLIIKILNKNISTSQTTLGFRGITEPADLTISNKVMNEKPDYEMLQKFKNNYQNFYQKPYIHGGNRGRIGPGNRQLPGGLPPRPGVHYNANARMPGQAPPKEMPSVNDLARHLGVEEPEQAGPLGYPGNRERGFPGNRQFPGMFPPRPSGPFNPGARMPGQFPPGQMPSQDYMAGMGEGLGERGPPGYLGSGYPGNAQFPGGFPPPPPGRFNPGGRPGQAFPGEMTNMDYMEHREGVPRHPGLPEQQHPGTMPGVHDIAEHLGVEAPGYADPPGIPGPHPGPGFSPPMPHYGTGTGVTPRPRPGDLPRPTRPLPPSVHEDPQRPFGSLLHQNHHPGPTTPDPFVEGLLKDMQERKNGYLTTFLIKLFEIVATKKKEHVRPLFRALETNFDRLYENRMLLKFGEPLGTKVMDIVRMINSAPADVIQSHATTLHYSLTTRKQYISAEVNRIIDYADSLYTQYEGRALLKKLEEVKNYPNVSKSAAGLVNDVVEGALLAPYTRMTGTEKLQILFDNINHAILSRFPSRRQKEIDKLKKRRKKDFNKRELVHAKNHTLFKIYKLKSTRRMSYKKHGRNIKERKRSKRNRYDKKNKETFRKELLKIHDNMSNINMVNNNAIKYDINKNIEIKISKKLAAKIAKTKYSVKVSKTTLIKKSFEITRKGLNTPSYIPDKKTVKSINEYVHPSKSKKMKDFLTEEDMDLFKTTLTDSNYSFDEKEFKVKVDDVFRHGDNVQIRDLVHNGRRNIAKRKNKINYVSSCSDEETVLKQNIYKAFNIKI